MNDLGFAPTFEELRTLRDSLGAFQAMTFRPLQDVEGREAEWRDPFLAIVDSLGPFRRDLQGWDDDATQEFLGVIKMVDRLIADWGWQWAALPFEERRRYILDRGKANEPCLGSAPMDVSTDTILDEINPSLNALKSLCEKLVPTLNQLVKAVGTRSCWVHSAKRTFPPLSDEEISRFDFVPDENAWPGLERLSTIVRELSGLEIGIDLNAFNELIYPRLRRFPILDPGQLTLLEVAELIERTRNHPVAVCSICGRTLQESRTDKIDCQICKDESEAAYKQSMAHMVTWSNAVIRGDQTPSAFFVEMQEDVLGRQKRPWDDGTSERLWDLVLEKWGDGSNPGVVKPWSALVKFLKFEHGLRGDDLAKTTKAAVVKLLEASLGREAKEVATDDAEPSPSSSMGRITASQADVTKFRGLSPNYTGYLEDHAKAGDLTFEKVPGTVRKFFVTFTDPKEHERALKHFEPKPRPHKPRKGQGKKT